MTRLNERIYPSESMGDIDYPRFIGLDAGILPSPPKSAAISTLQDPDELRCSLEFIDDFRKVP